MYFIILKLHSFCVLFIAVASIYSYRGGILASFLNSAVAVRITDMEILIVLVTRLLKQDLNRLVNEMEPVEL
jgi:hypothetical protein